ncbi:unnamed protein product, partial [Mycena citricolor]
ELLAGRKKFPAINVSGGRLKLPRVDLQDRTGADHLPAPSGFSQPACGAGLSFVQQDVLSRHIVRMKQCARAYRVCLPTKQSKPFKSASVNAVQM